MTGYAHPLYSKSFMEFGIPRELPRCKGWILERQIPGSPYRDAMGCYPLFVCDDWSQLQADLEEIGKDLVSISLVTDPFGKYDLEDLHRCFKDVFINFKEHYIVDLQLPINEIVSKHHQYYTRKTLEQVCVTKINYPLLFVNEWINFHKTLVEKHNIKGIKAFSRKSFIQQFCVPGIVTFQAMYKNKPIGAHIWYVQGEVAYSHLAACSPLGYELMASYPLYYFAIEYFADKVQRLDLGAGAGVSSASTDGLSQFKSGWSTGTRPTYFCGRIFDHNRYSELTNSKGISTTDYFPAYRQGEFR